MPHESGIYHLKPDDLYDRCSLALCVMSVSNHKSVINTVFWLGSYSNFEGLECIKAQNIIMKYMMTLSTLNYVS